MRRWHREIVLARLCLLLAWISPLGLAVGVGGCATSSAGTAAPMVAQAQTDTDRLPAQVASQARIPREPDEPSQPFSRNYGLASAMRLLAPPARMTDAEADALIAHAIGEHEMRRP
jgi:hypothetical protein